MFIWPAKAPGEVEDFEFDFSKILQSGENIVSRSIAASGVTAGSDTVAGGAVSLMLSGGTAGTVAKVICTIVTNSAPARTYSEVAVLEIGGDPVSLAEAKAWLRIEDSSAEDDIVAALLRAAIAHIEASTGKKLVSRIVSQTLDGFGFPAGGCQPFQPWPAGGFAQPAIRLRHGPVSEILSIDYDDGNGNPQTLASFRLVEGGACAGDRLLPAYGAIWPVTANGGGAVRISYVAGYDPTALPHDLTVAVRLLVAHWYQNREAVAAGDRAAAVELPLGVAELIAPYSAPGIA